MPPSTRQWPDAIDGLGPGHVGPYTPCDLCGTGTWLTYGRVPLCLTCARQQASLTPPPRTMTREETFALLDELYAGLVRDAQRTDAERAQQAEPMRQWLAPLLARLDAAWTAHPCLGPRGHLVLDVTSGAVLEDTRPTSCACEDCFNQRYAAWKRARGHARPRPTTPAPTGPRPPGTSTASPPSPSCSSPS